MQEKLCCQKGHVFFHSEIFSKTKFFWINEKFPSEMFRHCDAKQFRWKNMRPTLSLNRKFLSEHRDVSLSCIFFFDTQKYRNIKGLHYLKFQHCERQKKSAENCATPFLTQRVFL